MEENFRKIWCNEITVQIPTQHQKSQINESTKEKVYSVEDK